MKTALITGITGQDGAYLSQQLYQNGYSIVGVVRNINNYYDKRLKYLGINDKIRFEECNILDLGSVMHLLQETNPDEIYNLASQSSVGTSFIEPISTIETNTQSVLTLLESIRLLKLPCKFYQASSSEMFGRINSLPITENSIMHPVSPYAISKATAYWTTVCYRESYDIFACNGILFNHESYLRGANFFVKKIIRESIELLKGNIDHLRVGNLDVKRDFGYAPDYVNAMYLMMQQSDPDDYVICSGKSIRLRDIVHFVFSYLGLDESRIIEDPQLFRPNEIEDIWGDNSKAKNKLNWKYEKDFTDVLRIIIDEELNNTER